MQSLYNLHEARELPQNGHLYISHLNQDIQQTPHDGEGRFKQEPIKILPAAAHRHPQQCGPNIEDDDTDKTVADEHNC